MAIVLSGSTGIDAGSLPVANTGKISAGAGLPVILNTAGVDRVTVDTSGNVGIGTNSPEYSLDVINTLSTGTIADNAIILLKSSNRNTALRFDTIGGSHDGGLSNYVNSVIKSQLSMKSSGDILSVLPNGGLGYGTGAGGTVTQLTSKSTAVTLNKPTGTITTHNATMTGGAAVSFSVTNTLVSSTDTIVLSTSTTSYAYTIACVGVANGSFIIRILNNSVSSLSENIAINFVLIKGAQS